MRRTEGFPRSRRGFLIYLVLFVIIVLAVLTVHFHRLSRHSQAMAYRFEQSDVVRFLAEAALEEAFGFFWRQTARPGSPEVAWLLSHSPTPRTVPVPLTLKQAPGFTRSMYTPSVEVRAAQISDFRDQDSKGAKYYRYPRSGAAVEGVGTIEFTAKVRLTTNSSPPKDHASCVYVRHHDFKIVSVVTQRNNTGARDMYSHNALLDYAFFVRNGYREFEDQAASPLNQTRVKIVIDQSAHPQNRLGKVFFGGTQKPGQFVFLNTYDDQKAIIPPLNAQEVQRIQYLDVLDLFPRLKKALDDNSPPIPYTEFNGLEGVFVANNVPARRSPYPSGKLGELERMTSDALISLAAGSAKNIEPQQEILCTAKLGDAAYADTVFEGAIRQRFLHFIHYYLDATKLNPDAAKILAQEDYKMPCIPNPPNPPGDQDVKDFLAKLPAVAAKYATPDKPLISCFQTDFLLKAGLAWPGGKATTSFPNPTFYNKAGNQVADPEDIGTDGIQPYHHVNLWGRRMSGMNDLEEQGIVDYKTNEIRPRGVEWVNGDMIIGKNGGTLTIKGQGVLIANGNIQIDSNLVKASVDDFLVLCTREGQIIVKAGSVQASLIAVGTSGTGCIIPTVPMTLTGAFAAERLNLNQWAGGTHSFRYDPVLMGGQDRYTVHLSPAITFQRITEQE